MITKIILERCETQAVQIKSKILDRCVVPPNCLGGEMKPLYEKVCLHQIELVNAILQKLQEQNHNI